MTCVLRSVLAALLMFALSVMLASDPLIAGVDPELRHSHALHDGVGGTIDHHGQGGTPPDRACTSMIGHCGSTPLHDVTASHPMRQSAAPALLPPDDRVLPGRSPEADTPPPRI